MFSKNIRFVKSPESILLLSYLALVILVLLGIAKEYNLRSGAKVIKEGSFTIYVDTTDPSYVDKKSSIDYTLDDTTNGTNNSIIHQEDKIFNKIEADKALDNLIKILLKTGNFNKSNNNVFICSGYNTKTRCYTFSQGEDMDDRYTVINWWQYNFDSKKVINDITGEELIY